MREPAVNNFKRRNKNEYIHDTSTDDELEQARLLIIRDHQIKHYRKQMNELGEPDSSEKLSEDCSIWYAQKTKVLRFYGRVTSDNLSLDEKFPILIAPNTSLADLLMRQARQKVGQGGAQQMLQFLRKQYWITRA